MKSFTATTWHTTFGKNIPGNIAPMFGAKDDINPRDIPALFDGGSSS